MPWWFNMGSCMAAMAVHGGSCHVVSLNRSWLFMVVHAMHGGSWCFMPW